MEVITKLSDALIHTNEQFSKVRFREYIETSIDKNTIINTKKSTTWDM